MLERARNEPVVLIVLAAAVIALGVDLPALTDTVNRLLDLLVLVGGAGVARQQVTPTRKEQ